MAPPMFDVPLSSSPPTGRWRLERCLDFAVRRTARVYGARAFNELSATMAKCWGATERVRQRSRPCNCDGLTGEAGMATEGRFPLHAEIPDKHTCASPAAPPASAPAPPFLRLSHLSAPRTPGFLHPLPVTSHFSSPPIFAPQLVQLLLRARGFGCMNPSRQMRGLQTP